MEPVVTATEILGDVVPPTTARTIATSVFTCPTAVKLASLGSPAFSRLPFE